MERTNAERLAAIKNSLKQSGGFDSKSVEQIRREMAETAKTMPVCPEVAVKQAAIGHLGGEWILPDNLASTNENQAILYFHGGGFVAGTCEFYRDLCARIAKSSETAVLAIEYRLAPEHPYPAANDDCLTAYRWLLANGYSPRHIVLGGDSVGGCLALMTLIALRDQGQRLPAGAFLMSPHTDLVNLDGETYISRAELDPTGSLAASRRILEAYAGSRSENIPALSPVNMNLELLPPLFIQVGDHEVLLSDALRLAHRAQEAGVAVELEIWESMWSVFQFLAYLLPEARQAIANIGQFVQALLPRK